MQRNNLNNRYETLLGRNVIIEAFKAGRVVKQLYIEKGIENSVKSGQNSKISDIILLAKRNNVNVEFVSKDFLIKSERENGVKSEGIIAKVDLLEDMGLDDVLALCKRKNKDPFIVIINNILYEENLGAVIRTCAAGNVDALIVPKRDKRDINPNVSRISMGGINYVPFIKDNLFEILDKLKEEAIKIVALDMNGSKFYYDETLTGPVAVLLGGETGLSEPLLKRSDSIVKIPMLGKIESLNLSVSAGIVIYEKIRQECQI